MKTKNEYRLVVVIGMLSMLLVVNYAGDIMYRYNTNEYLLDNNKYRSDNNDNWLTQSQINENANKIHDIQITVLEQMDKDIRSNMKVVDQLIGIILGDGFT